VDYSGNFPLDEKLAQNACCGGIVAMKCKVYWMLLSLAVCVVPSLAAINQPNRIHGVIPNTPTVALKSNVHPMAQPQNDEGPVDPGMKLDRIVMFFQSTPAQQADLKQFLQDLQNPSSPSYHKWLTPEQYAARFGVSKNDIAKIENWLTSQGFEIVQPARGRNWIAFSGTAELVEEAFHTEIHYYNVNGIKHFANATNPSIPQALTGIVMGFHGLDDFRLKPMNIRTRQQSGVANPFYSSGGFNNLAPADIAAIYDVQSLYNAGYTGSGQKLVVVGQTDIDTADIAAFRSGFGLSANLPTSVLVPTDTDPGQTGDLPEADLDLEWSGAVAQDASITFVIGGIAGNQGGVFDAAQYAIDNDLAPVISMSYGGCEAANVTFIPYFENFLVQASAQGQTFLASSGDAGAAACDGTYPSGPVSLATYGPSVNYPASSPEVTGVGGTEFNEGGGTYWNCNPGNLGTACGYIPEIGWNDTTENTTLTASGGGKSSCGVESNGTCTGGFAKPSWQVGTGVPADHVRDVPDVSLAASANHDGYILCTGGSCAGGIANAVNQGSIYGGTSASAPAFAGIVVLMNQYVAANGGTLGLGNINQKLYQFASTSAFHDVTTGNNIVPCQSGSTGCPGSGQFGFTAGTGYDLVTGLGSVDANELARAFAPLSTTTTLALSPPPSGGIYVGTSQTVTLTATVTASGGTGTPTGTVTFMDGSNNLGNGTVSSGVATLSNVLLNGGTHSLTAMYSGDSTFPGSTSAPTEVLVTLDEPNTTVAMATPASGAYGTPVTLSATVTATSNSNTPTGTVTFTVGATTLGTATLSGSGTSASGSVQTTFIPTGSNTITASYNGDANYGFSNGTTAATISKASTTTGLMLSSSTVDAGSTVTFTATVPQPGGGSAPSGTVTFVNGSTTIGTGTLSNGTATFSSSSLKAGTYNVTASYPGDTNYTSSISSPSALAVQSFTLSSGVTIGISAPGQGGMGTLMATPIAGFTGTISYSCTLVLAGAACSTAPTSGGVTVTVTTTAPSSDLVIPGRRSGMFYAMLLPGLFGVVLVGFRKRTFRGMHVITLLLILGLSTLWMGACGGGPSGSTGGGGGGTPIGATQFTVTGTSGTISVTQTVSLNVQ
jgi:hypothetical protein